MFGIKTIPADTEDSGFYVLNSSISRIGTAIINSKWFIECYQIQ
ncbi:MAG: hypothetical protein ACM3XP_05905 [Nitrososphaerales archaeon]